MIPGGMAAGGWMRGRARRRRRKPQVPPRATAPQPLDSPDPEDVAGRQRSWYTPRMGQLVDGVRAALRASKETPYAIAKGAGIARSQLSRLLSGERGMTADTIERLAGYLGLEIVIRPKRTRKGR